MSFIKQGKKSRNELQLPILHFVVVDDWMPKLGKSFELWLKLHTLADRSDSARQFDLVPRSMKNLAAYLEISEQTLYRRIAPLWEFGLVDIIEYEGSYKTGQKPKNIIVYEYPKNEKSLSVAPLEKCRDWKTDYSPNVQFGKIGGEKLSTESCGKVQESPSNSTPPNLEATTLPKMEATTLPNLEANNVSNSLYNDSNILNNGLEEEGAPPSEKPAAEKLKFQNEFSEKEILAARSFVLPQMRETLSDLNLEPAFADRLVCYMKMANLKYISASEFRSVNLEIEKNGGRDKQNKKIMDKAIYILRGILWSSRLSVGDGSAAYRQEKARKKSKSKPAASAPLPFYNWLEN